MTIFLTIKIQHSTQNNTQQYQKLSITVLIFATLSVATVRRNKDFKECFQKFYSFSLFSFLNPT